MAGEIGRSGERRVELITAAALTLARATTDDLDGCIEKVIGAVGTFAGADRVHVFQLDPNGTELSCTHEWCGERIDSFRDDMQFMPVDLFPWLLRQLRTTGTLALRHLDELPVAGASERQILTGLGALSAVAVPLIHGSLLGFVGYEAITSVDWRREDLNLIETVAELVTSAITRKDAWDRQEKLIAELRVALTEVTTLSGLLPICASCKSVRDDKGYWHRVEAYLHTHSDLEFTHGLCPKCADELATSD